MSEALVTHQAISHPQRLLNEVRLLRQHVIVEGEALFAGWRETIHCEDFLESARNLAHYLVLRRMDLRDLQAELSSFGLSSLGRLEGRVVANLDAVTAALSAIVGEPGESEAFPAPDYVVHGARVLKANTELLFGPARRVRSGYVMVTLPSEAAEDSELAERLIANRVDSVRINCAHDDPDAWASMIGHVRSAAADAGRRINVLMDLAGPKVRTAELHLAEGVRRLYAGDRFMLVRQSFSETENWPAQMTCTIPQVFDNLRQGSRVWFDDGKLGGIVERLDDTGAVVHVTRAGPKGVKLKTDKGLNFPDTSLGISPLTAKDREDLAFIVENADMVGYSFVQAATDIAELQDELKARRGDGWRDMGLVAKIETPRALASLPQIIVQAAGQQPFGVMIARGDLAVELGYERLAEMQEEMLWLCESARVPVIWATQVLENLVKKGIPSRGEMTDAAMAGRAECVMLNKGPYVAEAASVLDRLMTRMAEHQFKKTPLLRALRSW